MARDNREVFIAAYIAAALWSSSDTDDDGNERQFDDGDFELSDEARDKLEGVAGTFFDAHSAWFLAQDAERQRQNSGPAAHAGHDLWLTQNGHGCGFWDGGWNEPNASELTASAKAIGEITLYLGDDDLIYAT
jgi:hypothetical protein